jgi:hypothetical protein
VESVKYYFNKVDEIMQPGYLASDDDILYARVRTSGIVTERCVTTGSRNVPCLLPSRPKNVKLGSRKDVAPMT